MRRTSLAALSVPAALLGLVGCKALFGVEEPPLLVDTALPTCAHEAAADASTSPPTWIPVAGFGLFPLGTEGLGNRQRDSVSVEHVAVLRSLVAFASDKEIFALERASLYSADGGAAYAPLTPALRIPPEGSDIGRTVYGLAQSEPLGGPQGDSGAPSAILSALLCRWQEGCSLEYASETALQASLREGEQPPDSDAGVPCRGREAPTDLKGGVGYGCFPFAAPVDGSGFLFDARPVGSDIALCVTQGTGGTEDRAKYVGCRIAAAEAGGGVMGPLGQQVRVEVTFDENEERPRAVAVDGFEARDAGTYPRVPMRLVTPTTLYLANTVGSGERVKELTDALIDMPPRTITAHDLQPNTTWLAVEMATSAGTRSEIWHVEAPPWGSAAGALPPVSRVYARKGTIVAITYAPARKQLYWVEEVLTGSGSERTIFRAPASVAPGGTTACAEALPEPSTQTTPRGLNIRKSSVRIFVPPTDRSRGCAEHEELYVLSAKNLWGRPAQGTAPCAPTP